MQPFLFIGLGGSGGKTLRFTWTEIKRRLRASGWDEPYMPRCFRFLHIDLPPTYDGNTEAGVPRIRDLESKYYEGLATRRASYATYDDTMLRNDRWKGFLRWRPYPPRDIVNPERGAGQRRAVGRVVALHQASRIVRNVQEATNAFTSQDAATDLLRLRSLVADGDTWQGSGQIIITSSIAGGTGSGLLLDVVEAVQSLNLGLADDPIVAMIAPDVFESLEAPTEGIHPNALATLAELLNGHRNRGTMPPVLERALRAGVMGAQTERVSDNLFIFGRSSGSEGVSLNSPSKVYETLGRTWASMAMSARLQQPFQYIINRPATAINEPYDRVLGDIGSIQSGGYALVGLGRDLYAEYASQRLGRLAVQRLMRAHLETGDDQQTEEARLADTVRSRWAGSFGTATGLVAEPDAEYHPIVDALREREAMVGRVTAVKEDFLRALRSRGDELDGNGWLQRHNAEANRTNKLERDETTMRLDRARAWVTGVEEKVLAATSVEIAVAGLPATVRLLDRLHEQCTTDAGELRKREQTESETESQYSDDAKRTIKRITTVITGDATEHDLAAKLRFSAVVRRIEAETAGLAARLLDDIADNLIAPLRRRLSAVLNAYHVSEQAEPTKSVLPTWPERAVPGHLNAAENERLLTPVAQFPDLLEQQLQQLFEGHYELDAVRSAVVEIITGSWRSVTGEMRAPDLIVPKAAWQPKEGTVRPGDQPASQAEFAVDVELLDLDDRAAEWMRERQGPISSFLDQTLAEFLRDPDHQTANREAFKRELQLVLQQSRPLYEVNTARMSAIHGRTGPDLTTTLSTLPLQRQPGDSFYDEVERLLDGAGISTDNVHFDPQHPATEVDVLVWTTTKVHPAVIDSVVAPIAREWDAAAGSNSRTFWDCRRTRTLEAFAPGSRDDLDDLCAGYIVAVALGMIELPTNVWSDEERHVWAKDGPKRLPRKLLDPQGAQIGQRALAPLVESLPLSWLTIGDPDETLAGYARLMRLGDIDYGVHADIVTFLRDGHEALGVPRPHLLGDLPDDPEGRRDAFVGLLEKQERQYAAMAWIQEEGLEPHAVRPVLEIAHIVSAGLERLISAIRELTLTGGGAGDLSDVVLG